MSPETRIPFSCETYLLAFSAGARDGLVGEHVDHCLFCRDIVHGGTKEFPLSYDEEVAQRRRLSLRTSRRRFLKVGVAAVVGLATMGTTGVIASKYLFHPTQVIEHKRKKSLDQIFAAHGRQGVVAYLDRSTIEERVDTHTWIAERGHASLIDLMIADADYYDETIRTRVVVGLGQFPPAALTPWKTALINAQLVEPEDVLVDALNDLIATIP